MPASSLDQKLAVARKILISRFLTRSGDQAWDFAVPIVLLQLFPQKLQVAAAYYFFVRLGHVILMPYLAAVIDRVNRRTAALIGIVTQLLGVMGGAAVIGTGVFEGQLLSLPFFGVLIISGLVSSLGGSFMEISVASDLVPSAIPKEDLPRFNSRLRQIDLFTEVASPIAAGSILLLGTAVHPLLGFFLIAFWNFVSFVPEYFLLKAIFKARPDLNEKTRVPTPTKQSLLAKISHGWRSFLKEPVAPAVTCYSLLWLSVLSPHGVLLTGFLKGGWHMPEIVIGVFRGLGALFGLLATLLFPIVVRRLGLLKGSQSFVVFQAIVLVLGLFAFHVGGTIGQLGFLMLILFSRVGLYGFSLGEMQIRQIGISSHVRGEVNGFANAMTGVATLLLYGAGALLPSTEDFPLLVQGSVGFVCLAALLFSLWVRKTVHFEKFELETPGSRVG